MLFSITDKTSHVQKHMEEQTDNKCIVRHATSEESSVETEIIQGTKTAEKCDDGDGNNCQVFTQLRHRIQSLMLAPTKVS